MARSLDTDSSCMVGMFRFLTKYTDRLASGRKHLDSNILMPMGEVSHFDPGMAITPIASACVRERCWQLDGCSLHPVCPSS